MLARLARFAARKAFRPLERHFGLHVTPAHFYSPIPTVSELDPAVFQKRFDCIGVDWNLPDQFEQLRIFQQYAAEFTPAANQGLSLVDASALYAMIRERKPKVMIEIGAGASTLISLMALQRNLAEGHPYEFYSIEPYPTPELRGISGFTLIDKKLQDVSVELLSTADILFIDSSHVSKIGSDVNYEMLEIVPRLKVGSLVHWHDIVMPTNYWREWIEDGNMFWNESYMVHSFMLFNDSFKIQWAARYMQLTKSKTLAEAFPYLRPDHHLMSFWVRRVK